MKRILAISLAVLLLAGCTASTTTSTKTDVVVNLPDGFPITAAPITLNVLGEKAAVHSAWADMEVFKLYEELTGIKMVFEDVPQAGYREKLNLMLASNELPDVFVRGQLTPMDVAKYGPTGALLDLNPYIEKGAAPNVKALLAQYPEIREAITSPDGCVYSLPTIVTVDLARTEKNWINKVWLGQLGLEVPKTTDELVNVLEQFKNKIPNSIPLTGVNIASVVNNFGGSFGLHQNMNYSINIDGGKVNIWFGDDNYKKELEFLTGLYSKGLLDRDIFTHKQQEFVAKLHPDKIGFVHRQADDNFAKNDDQFIGIAPLKGPDGYQFKHINNIARDFGAFAISAINKYPAETLRWIDYFYGEEGSIFFRMGILGKHHTADAQGNLDYSDAIKNDPNGMGVAMGRLTAWSGGSFPHLIDARNSIAVNSGATMQAQEALAPYLDTTFPMPILDLKTQQEAANIRNDIDKYVAETRSSFITGKTGFDKWDEYVETLEKIGIKKLEEIYQKAYDEAKK